MIAIRELLSLFDRRERVQLAGLLALLVVGAGLETMGVGLVMPFIALVSDPGIVDRHSTFRWLKEFLGPDSNQHFLLLCGVILFCFYVLKNAYLGVVAFIQYRFIYGKMHRLSRHLLDTYLRAPYRFHMTRNSAELQRNINTDVPLLFNWVVSQAFICVSDLLVVAVITGLLIWIDPISAAGAIALFGTFSVLFLKAIRRWTHRLGRHEQQSFGSMVKWVNQGLGGIKETKVLGHESYFVDAYSESCAAYTNDRRTILTVNELPRFFFETIAVGGMLVVILVFLAQEREIATILPTLALFAAATFRLMPAMTRILRTTSMIRHFRPSLDVVHADLAELETEQKRTNGEPFPFEQEMELRDVSFRYAAESDLVLNGVSLRIGRNETVGFVGSSGAGKTTIVDLILGLLPPDAGAVLADGRDIRENVGAWQRNFGYIPQDIYLIDDTIRRNVAYGYPDDEIDDDAVRRALAAAKLDRDLDGVVGERGIQLSGGQRQRIGIARALYRDPSVLILDEATSSLDRETEREIGETIQGLRGGRTILIIAHRFSMVRGCDRVFFLDRGRVAAEGTFDEIAAKSSEFRKMAELEDPAT